jgi:hypothetical protein
VVHEKLYSNFELRYPILTYRAPESVSGTAVTVATRLSGRMHVSLRVSHACESCLVIHYSAMETISPLRIPIRYYRERTVSSFPPKARLLSVTSAAS